MYGFHYTTRFPKRVRTSVTESKAQRVAATLWGINIVQRNVECSVLFTIALPTELPPDESGEQDSNLRPIISMKYLQSSHLEQCPRSVLIRRPLTFQASALPTELQGRNAWEMVREEILALYQLSYTIQTDRDGT